MNLFGMRSRWLVLSVVGVVLAGCGQSQDAGPGFGFGGPALVEAQVVQPRSLTLVSELPGRIESVRVAEVRARVPGIVLNRNFEEGADVEAGQLLFQIDPAPYRAALSRAQAELARADASLADAQAVVKRYESLVRIEAVSQQDFDSAQATFKSAQAARQAAVAEVETARLNLGYATVTAPISGRIGRAQVTEGALVGQNDATLLATIQQFDSVYVDFKQPVADFLRLREAMDEGWLTQNEGAIPLTVKLDGTRRTYEGTLLFSDITVDRGTGQVSLRGRFTNPDGLLLPGMYVRVQVSHGTDPEAMLVPQRAVQHSSDGQASVLIVAADQTAEVRPVRVGSMQGTEWHILEGLQAGDQVIVNGAAMPGTPVRLATADPAAAPANQ